MNILFQKEFQRVFGTFPLLGNELRNAVLTATEVGYRAFDTAQMYKNEEAVGQALQETQINRSDLCIITKIHPENFSPSTFKESLMRSIENLRTNYIDVLFLHWPPKESSFEQTLDLLAEVQSEQLVKSVGVSNFTSAMMKSAKAHLDVPLVANQVEFHPLLDQSKLLQAANDTGIPLMSYSAIARGKVFESELLQQLSSDYNKTVAQVVLRWVLQKGVIANSMSTKRNNIRDNFNVMDFVLSSIDMARIDDLQKANYRIVTKEKVPWAPNWD